jgi:hypothetical protein
MRNYLKTMKFLILLLLIFQFSFTKSMHNETDRINADICIVGAGSAGIGAAIAASRSGANVILIEKENIIGGTSTMSYVNSWEPGPGCSYAYEIYNRLSQKPNATGVAKQIHTYDINEPYGIFLVNKIISYNNSLRRSDLNVNEQCASVSFDINEFDDVVREILNETGNCQLLLNTTFVKANTDGSRISSVEAVSSSGEKFIISAKVFIDCTGCAFVCRDIGCEVMIGEEPESLFGEPSAPETSDNWLNAISLCYQIKPKHTGIPNPGTSQNFDYNVVAHVTGPVGDDNKLTVNPLGIIDGNMIINGNKDSIYLYGRELVNRHWAKLQTYPHFKNYEFDSYAPRLGIRESYRVVCDYVLTQHDLLKGLSQQSQNDIITVADHPMDLHGKSNGLNIIREPYGVPYRSLIPAGWDNLLVAGKCAGFSHIAASSCRLSRTMMSLGHAAGFAAWLCFSEDKPLRDIQVNRLKAEMNLKLRAKYDLSADPLPINNTIGMFNRDFYISDNGCDSIFQISMTGEIKWSYPAANTQDLWILPSGNILYTYHHGEKGRGGVIEITKNKKIIFKYETDGEVHTCQRLLNGNTLIGINNTASLVEVDKSGNVLKSLPLKTERKGHDAIRMARKLDNGNYLVCQEGDHIVAEYDPSGNMVNTFQSPGKCFEAIRLDNGNTLISDGSACSVRELDKEGKVVWQISKEDFPEIKMNWLAGMDVLPNGNIIICNWLGHGKSGEGIPVFEINRDKEIVGYYLNNVRTKSVSNVAYNKNFFDIESKQKDNQSNMIIYPNPAKLIFSFASKEKMDINNIRVFDFKGREVKAELSRSSDNIVQIDLSGNNSGIYLVRLKTDDDVYSQKVMYIQ